MINAVWADFHEDKPRKNNVNGKHPDVYSLGQDFLSLRQYECRDRNQFHKYYYRGGGRWFSVHSFQTNSTRRRKFGTPS